MQEILLAQGLAINFLIFLLLACGIWLVGSRLTYLADAICDRYNLGASTVGLLFLALSTSLPEVATTVSAALIQNSDLVLNNLFGGIALQTAVLAFADFWARGAISNYPRKANHALEATLLVALMACLQVVLILGEPISIFGVGIGSILIAFAYAGSITLLRWYDGGSHWIPVDLPDLENDRISLVSRKSVSKLPSPNLILISGIACVLIMGLGVAIVEVSEVLAKRSGMGSGFFGVTFLAAATSLPEVSTTITAVRMGAYTLAISNVFGSNLIMIVLIFPADILYFERPILDAATASTQLAIACGSLVTAIYLVGLIVRRKPKIGPIGVDSFLVLVVYASSLLLYYGLT
ncbi:MAG: hypothetical protein QNJ29_03490 [Rhizobiaceae bacterium]|nr:hypothetical protein [Rhizobiaceae bacterium]